MFYRSTRGLQWRIQEFQNGAGARYNLRYKVCFDGPSNISYVFVRRVVNNIRIVNTACYTMKIYKNQVPFFFQRGGGGVRCTGPGSPFGLGKNCCTRPLGISYVKMHFAQDASR